MADNQILFETLFSGLKNLKEIQDGLVDELNLFEDQYSKDYKIVNDRLNAINVQIDKTIKDAISAIKLPEITSKDEIISLIESSITNIDETQLREDLKGYITRGINSIPSPKNGEDGKDGENGKDATNQQVSNAVDDWITENSSLLIGDKGEKGERGLIGQSGQNGNDGIGIEEITREKNELVFTMSDGSEKRVELPKQQIMQGGGGGTSLQNATSTQIVKVNSDINLGTSSQTVLVDATSGNINIKLPNPSNCFFGRSYKIGITRIDTADNNQVFLNSFNGEQIVFQDFQEILTYEVLNLVTDGKNWWYGN